MQLPRVSALLGGIDRVQKVLQHQQPYTAKVTLGRYRAQCLENLPLHDQATHVFV